MSFCMKKAAALGLAGLMTAATLLTGCGSASGSSASGGDGSEDFSMLLLSSMDSTYIDSLNDGPAAQYWLLKEWDADGDGEGTTITMDLIAPTAGSEQDYVNTLLATGEYPDVLPSTYVSDSAKTLYDDGVILDLTDYVKEYMPNLQAWLDANPNYYMQLTTEIDGEQRLLNLPIITDAVTNAWGSYCYRRDWIAKYGTNPTTGEAFTYEWVEDEDGTMVMTDDIVFPSGETDPYTISDWEWMFGIFAKALKAEGISDGYCAQLTSDGFVSTGDLNGGFGGTMGYYWYIDKNNEVQCGLTDKHARAYVECVTNWYNQGWVNTDFEENVGEMWFSCDADHVYSGKVGLWYGLTSQWGNAMDTGSGDYTDGIYVAVAPQPINDVYGDEDCQNVEPMCFYQASIASHGAYITNKAADKDLPTLLTALDWLYSDEGALVRDLGLSDTMLDELEANGHEDITQLYRDYDIDGGYTEVVADDGTVTYVVTDAFNNAPDSLKTSLNLSRVFGETKNAGVDRGYSETRTHQQELADMYTAWAAIGMLPDKLSTEDADEKSLITTNITTYTSQAIPEFITGRTELNDETWDAYVKDLQELGCDDVTDMLNEVAGN